MSPLPPLRRLLPASALLASSLYALCFTSDAARQDAHVANVTITRDQWGIPHVSGKRNADAVFGLIYAQAEDDFQRIELNYINAMGRLAEVAGETALAQDLRMKLFIDPLALKQAYERSPAWMQRLMQAWADGLNYFLHTHPDIKPRLITHFEPWMALSFTEGSIGGDIESVDTNALRDCYLPADVKVAYAVPLAEPEPQGSNGFAISPKITQSGHALLMINPHTSFYFRPEVHARSEEGLNAYGAVTWGQFFVYQGFNEHLGWMHTSGGGNVISEYVETIEMRDGRPYYRHGNRWRPVTTRIITLPYRDGDALKSHTVTAWFTHHGPVVRKAGDKWVSVSLMNSPRKALMQSWLRTTAKDYAAFRKVLDLRTNSSNNTVYADDKGNIAYFHGNFMPRRDPSFDWRRPVDGSNPRTDWRGLHPVTDIIQILNPASGWIQNTNNWPFSAAGTHSPKREHYPDYMWVYPENARGLHALRVLEGKAGWTLEKLIGAAYDSYLTGFDRLIPALLQAWNALPVEAPQRQQLHEQVASLRKWDRRYALNSTATSLAIFWGQALLDQHSPAAKANLMPGLDYVEQHATAADLLNALVSASNKLQQDFGNWQTPWGEINRFQRLDNQLIGHFDDTQPSLPIPYASGIWGSLAAFGTTHKQGTKRIYGERGNSFVAAVEFGPKVRALSILAGGESGHPDSPHFKDQADMYSRGEFKQVLFYPEDIAAHATCRYRPGESSSCALAVH
ncbi:penicillin acylase family protein [Burkholderiaceae bacterium DAT-1]|nr:penicillin acylase family protein [Burkholderiaceae bacterium DAT-1]